MTYIVILRVFKPSLLLIMVYAGPEIGYYVGGGGGVEGGTMPKNWARP